MHLWCIIESGLGAGGRSLTASPRRRPESRKEPTMPAQQSPPAGRGPARHRPRDRRHQRRQPRHPRQRHRYPPPQRRRHGKPPTTSPPVSAAPQRAALALYPSSAYQAPAQVELHQATCLIVAGDPAEGARHAARTLQALPTAHHKDVLVHHTAALALSKVPPRARRLPDVIQVRELLALPGRQS
jgi:hypothetical protein